MSINAKPGRSFLGTVVLLALCLLPMLGCDSREPTPAPAAKQVRLGYFANITHAQAVLGVHEGAFANAVAPAKFSTKVFAAGPSLIEALLAGEIDIAYVGPGPAVSAFRATRGEGIRVVGAAASNGVLIVARKDSGIATLQDLKGRKIATPQYANTQDVAARYYLSKTLGQGSHDNVIAVAPAEQGAMMASGQIDAAWVPEPWGTRLIQENGAVLVGTDEQLFPGGEATLTVIVTTPEFLKAHPDVVDVVLKVNREYTARLLENPQAQVAGLVDGIAALTGKRLSPAVLSAALPHVKFTETPRLDSLQAMAQWTAELGMGKPVENLDQILDKRAGGK